jgi:hypothetical protein
MLRVPWVSREKAERERSRPVIARTTGAGKIADMVGESRLTEGGQVSWNSLGTIVGPLICWKPVWFSRN